jgi:hypothetical protein
MVRETENVMHGVSLYRARRAVVCLLVAAALTAVGGCSAASQPKQANDGASQSASDQPKGYGMGGVKQDIHVTVSAYKNVPAAPDLKTPESAVRSYLDWISYAYRIGTSEVSTPTMTAEEAIRVDAYNQYNLQKEQLLDQKLDSITFGKISRTGTSTVLPAVEKWTYSYNSVKKGGVVLRGPFQASYDTTYTLVKTPKGWVVGGVAAKSTGTVK